MGLIWQGGLRIQSVRVLKCLSSPWQSMGLLETRSPRHMDSEVGTCVTQTFKSKVMLLWNGKPKYKSGTNCLSPYDSPDLSC